MIFLFVFQLYTAVTIENEMMSNVINPIIKINSKIERFEFESQIVYNFICKNTYFLKRFAYSGQFFLNCYLLNFL